VAITNGYCTRANLTDQLRITDNIDDNVLDRAINAASRQIDGRCGRRFYVDSSVTARTYAPINGYLVAVDDISTTTGLIVKSDTGLDGTYATTLVVSTDYQAEPLNCLVQGNPITQIRALDANFYVQADSRATVQVTAKWGWPSVPVAIAEATALLSARIFKRYDSPLGVAGFGDLGAITVRRLDPDVEQLIAPYRLFGLI